MSKKLAKKADEYSGSPWPDLPPELLLKISSLLIDNIDLIRIRRVCSIWRSSIPPFPNLNQISSLFSGQSNPNRRLIPNGIYLLKNQSLSFILSLQESQPGKLLLRHPLTYKPIFQSSADSDLLYSLVSGWTITRLALSHSLENNHSGKPCFIPLFYSSSSEGCNVYEFMNLLLYCDKKPISCSYNPQSFVNFCGCTYAVNHNTVYLVNQCGSKPLICVNRSTPHRPTKYKKRFVVCDGDLYLLFNFIACVGRVKPNSRHKCRIYKLELDDLKCPTSYTMERVSKLGDRALFFNWDCSFSISTRHLTLLANRIFIAKSAFGSCRCSQDVGFRIYSIGGKFIRTFRSTLALFEPPPALIQKLNGLLHK